MLVSFGLLLAPLALAAIQVTKPSKDQWWVNESANVIEWKHDGASVDFVPYLTHPDISVLTADTPLLGIAHAYDTSILIDKRKFNVGKGYVIKLADVINSTVVLAASEPFEIKHFGSAYPDPPASSVSGTASAGVNVTATAKPAGVAGAARSTSATVPVVAALALGAAALVMA